MTSPPRQRRRGESPTARWVLDMSPDALMLCLARVARIGRDHGRTQPNGPDAEVRRSIHG